MTNKTITLDRELVSRIVGLRPEYTCAQLDADEELVRAALADPVPPAGDWGIDTTAGRPILVYQGCSVIEAEQAYYVLGLINGTVPPVGGDVEVLGYQVTRGTPTGVARLDRPMLSKVLDGWEPAFKVTELVDRAHVTRLQDEVDKMRWRKDVCKEQRNEYMTQRDALHSELTKARELFNHLYTSNQLSLADDERIENFLSNQSAPADKDGPDDCAHSEANKHGCPECGEEFKRADKGQCESVACTHGIRAPHACDKCEAQNAVPDYWEDPDTGTCIDQWSKIQGLNGTESYSIPLYRHAEQPAPVAAVMPERKTVKAGLLSESNTHNQGWNACLDEVARLNSEPKS